MNDIKFGPQTRIPPECVDADLGESPRPGKSFSTWIDEVGAKPIEPLEARILRAQAEYQMETDATRMKERVVETLSTYVDELAWVNPETRDAFHNFLALEVRNGHFLNPQRGVMVMLNNLRRYIQSGVHFVVDNRGLREAMSNCDILARHFDLLGPEN